MREPVARPFGAAAMPGARRHAFRRIVILHALKTLIFDLDGTLTDPFEGITRSYQHARERMGLAPLPDHVLPSLIGPPMREVFGVVGEGGSASIDDAVRFYRERYATVGLFENVVYPEIPAVIAELAQSYTLYVCTSKPTVFAVRILEHFELTAHFAAIYGAELDGTRADKRDLLAYLLERERVDPATAVMIGDRKFDIAAALANGVMPCGVTWGHGAEAELREAGARTLVHDPRELLAAF